MSFFAEAWEAARPHLKGALVDFAVTAAMYLGLFGFKLLAHVLPIGGWAGSFFVNLHSVGVLFAVGLFIWYRIVDMLALHRGSDN